MRAVVQRVSRAEVRIDGRVVGKIARGFVVLIGVAAGDNEADAAHLVDRIVGMRVFADDAGKMNLSIAQVEGELLVVSQFTLIADTNSGRRPSFIKAAAPEEARRLYDQFVSLARTRDVKVETGEFGATMEVDLVNDGPVTIILDSREK
ncbi:MAG: D-aminoacyl-tRNA deacylase [Candidatus Binatus sp.]|jgi:D-tyrosyl-tRNA(Tyr) deacylase|uniref:D-aminoacyl-tRNA deacylase n=1 Tax=Candidatus Binatus sp. TaxID=2811406 RepID=UPI003C711656